MNVLSVAVVVGALTAFAEQVVQKPAASVGSDRGNRDADRAAIEKLHQQDIAGTLSRDYENDDVKVRIQYRPGKSICPAENDPDGCEYFDVAADVTVTITGAVSHTYRTVGSGGC
jgi:hypothetical protein